MSRTRKTDWPDNWAMLYAWLGPNDSLDVSFAAARAFAEGLGLIVVSEIADRVPLDAAERPGWHQVVVLVHSRRVQHLVAPAISHLYRTMRQAADLGDLIDQGLQVHVVSGDFDPHTFQLELAMQLLK